MQALSLSDRRSREAIPLVPALLDVAAARPHPRITVVRAGALGDTVLLLPVLQTCRTLGPEVELTLVGSAWAEALRPLLPFPLTTVRLDAPALMPLFGPPPTQDRTGLFATADATILYTATPTSTFVRNVLGCCRGPVLIRSSIPSGGTHMAVHLARAIVSPPLAVEDLPLPALRPPADLATWAHQWVTARLGPGRRPMTLHPGSGGRQKQWPPAAFAALAKALVTPFILLEGPADAEACQQVMVQLPPTQPVALAAGLSLAQVAALIQECCVYVGNDSGLSHLAAALGVPTVVVVGPTDASVWAPLGRRVGVVRPMAGAAWPTPELVRETVRHVEA